MLSVFARWASVDHVLCLVSPSSTVWIARIDHLLNRHQAYLKERVHDPDGLITPRGRREECEAVFKPSFGAARFDQE